MNLYDNPLLTAPPSVLNVGIAGFNASITAAGASVADIQWRPPGDADPAKAWALAQLMADPRIAAANATATQRVINARPFWTDVALRVLGLGPGLTPSGDDLLGGTFFVLAHAPRPGWVAALPAVHARLRAECATATNVISAALLSDLMDGHGYRVLHDFVAALDGGRRHDIACAATALLRLGASSGADLMAGVLLALTAHPSSMPCP